MSTANKEGPAEFHAAIINGIATAKGVPAEKRLACIDEYTAGLIDEKVVDIVTKLKLAVCSSATERWVENHHKENPDKPIKISKD